MLTRLREIVEKVASAPQLDQALKTLADDICLAMNTAVCSVYLADHKRHCYYLMATHGLEKPRNYTITLAFDEGLIGLIGQLAEPLNLADAHKHANFKYIPAVKEDHLRGFLGVPVIQRRRLLAILIVQQPDLCQYSENQESFLVTLAAQLATVLSQSQLSALFGQYRHTRIHALAAVPGLAIAPGWMDSTLPLLEQISQASTLDAQRERERLNLALDQASNEFRRYSTRFAAKAQKETAQIFDLYARLLADTQLRSQLFRQTEKGATAEWAVKTVIENFVHQFASLNDHYLQERVGDLRTLGQRLLFYLDGNLQTSHNWPQHFILVADELSATTLAELPADKLAGIVVRDGAANSHAAIIARALGIPTVMGANIRPSSLHDRMLIVDGYRGELLIEPGPAVLQDYQRLLHEEQALSQLAEDIASAPARLKSGERINILLNAGLNLEHENNFSDRVDGIGLYRTETQFMLQNGFPPEEEQVAHYQHILQLFQHQPVTLRTLDIGADKPLPYLPVSEENPSLGWRGIRVTLDQPEIFLVQLRAMLRANVATGNLRILLPMISSLDEIDEAQRLIQRAGREVATLLGYEIPKPPIGIMLEVPCLIFMMAELAQRVDFISVGSNDLSQYLLAVDRNNTKVASLYDSLHPAVIRALFTVADAAQQHPIPLHLCGEMAGDPMGAVLLIGMGYRHLSMNGHAIARVKYLLQHITLAETQTLAKQVAGYPHASAIRQRLASFLEQRAIGGLVRGGH